MRVTLVLNHPLAPTETFQRSLVRTLESGGHRVTVHSLAAGASRPDPGNSVGLVTSGNPAAIASSLARGPHVHLARAARLATSRFGRGARALRASLLAAPILATDPEVVHLGFSGIGVALADALDLLDDTRIVVSCRGTDELVHAALDQGRAKGLGRLVRRADRIHVVAAALGEVVVGLGADSSAVRVIRPAVDLDVWALRRDRPPGPPWNLLAVTRLVPAKGIDDLVAALAMVREDGIDARLRVVGDGPHRDALRLRIRRSGLDRAVDLLGVLDPEGVRMELGAADLFVSPSHSEGISNGVLEAMASGVPVVSTEVGGMSEVLTDSVDGWLVPPGRPDRLASVISDVLATPATLLAVAAAGRQRVSEIGNQDDQRVRWLALYGELETEAGRPTAGDRPDGGS